jgi:hypothetical protein
VELGKARLSLETLRRHELQTQRELGAVLHRSRLLITQDQGPFLIEPQQCYQLDLGDTDTVQMSLVSGLPRTREEAIALAKRQRLEVRILFEGVAISRLQVKRNALRLLGMGSLPMGLANRESTGKTSIGLGEISRFDSERRVLSPEDQSEHDRF